MKDLTALIGALMGSIVSLGRDKYDCNCKMPCSEVRAYIAGARSVGEPLAEALKAYVALQEILLSDEQTPTDVRVVLGMIHYNLRSVLKSAIKNGGEK